MPPRQKVWNEELVRALVCRQRAYQAQGDAKQFTYSAAITKLRATRKEIKKNRTGTITNLPEDLGSGTTVNQLLQRLVQEIEPVVPQGMEPYDPAPGQMPAVCAQMIKEGIDDFVRRRMEYRKGSYAILMAFHKLTANTGGRRDSMNQDEIAALATPFCDDRFLPNWRQGVVRGCGWESHATLEKHSYLRSHQGRSGARGGKVYSLTVEGQAAVQKVVEVYGDPLAPAQGGGAGAAAAVMAPATASRPPSSGSGNGGSGHAAGGGGVVRERLTQRYPPGSDERQVENFVCDVMEAAARGDAAAGKVLPVRPTPNTAGRRQELHEFVDRLAAHHGVPLTHTSEGRGVQRAMHVRVAGPAGLPSAAAVPLPSAPPPKPAPKPAAKRTAKRSREEGGAVAPSTPKRQKQQQAPPPTPAAAAAAAALARAAAAKPPSPPAAPPAASVVPAAAPPAVALPAAPPQSPFAARIEDLEAQVRALKEEAAKQAAAGAAAAAPATAPAGEGGGGGEGVIVLSQESATDDDLAAAIKMSLAAPQLPVVGAVDVDALSDDAAPAPTPPVPALSREQIAALDEDAQVALAMQLSRGSAGSSRKAAAAAPPPCASTPTPVTLVIDERERSSNAEARALRLELQGAAADWGQRCGLPIEATVQSVPASDFVWQRTGTGEVLQVLMERKTISDIVSRSVRDDQTHQLEVMQAVNPHGVNVLIIDGDLTAAKRCTAFGHRDRVSVWDPRVRYAVASTAMEEEYGAARLAPVARTTGLRGYEGILVYLAALLTHGGTRLLLASDQPVRHLVAAMTATVAADAGPALHPDLTAFRKATNAAAADLRDGTRPGARACDVRKAARAKAQQEAALRECKSLPSGGDVCLRFSATPAFWEEYKAGTKLGLKAASLNDPDARVTGGFGRNKHSVVAEGAAWFDVHALSALLQRDVGVGVAAEFVELSGATQREAAPQLAAGASYATVSCVANGYASSKLLMVWENGLSVLNHIHDELRAAGNAADKVVPCVQAAATAWLAARFPPLAPHHRRIVFLTSVANSLKQFARAAVAVPAPAPGPEPNHLLALFACVLTQRHSVTCLTFGSNGAAFAAKLLQYASWELAAGAAHGRMHFVSGGM
eukprot:TRINITY_DN4211_c0_g1_i1.p1 TRINITY_DN4211_c0_g1~~TRINITY_DN4211_c0_g1_i1.p1  ORF type:complete len:1116 (+),score=290.41 TRINITY_DN4211_c0_g1_i1:204-3551(+)